MIVSNKIKNKFKNDKGDDLFLCIKDLNLFLVGALTNNFLINIIDEIRKVKTLLIFLKVKGQ